MTNNQIIQKAIDRAADNGWDFKAWKQKNNIGNEMVSEYRTSDLIFNHDFAKALWGEEVRGAPNSTGSGGRFDAGGMRVFESIVKKGWQRHLQDMVIAEDPIEYLGENI